MTRLDYNRPRRVVTELPEECIIMRLRYKGWCHECGNRCKRGARVVYDRAIKRFYCWSCAATLGWVRTP